MSTTLETFQQEPPIVNVFDTVLDAYRTDGFEAGYRRAVNDLLADFVLVANEFARETEHDSAQLRSALREFQARFEAHLERAASPVVAVDIYVDGGLGI